MSTCGWGGTKEEHSKWCRFKGKKPCDWKPYNPLDEKAVAEREAQVKEIKRKYPRNRQGRRAVERQLRKLGL